MTFLRNLQIFSLLFQIFIKVHIRQVCLYDGDTIVVLASLLAVDHLSGIAVRWQLEDVADMTAHRLHILVDDDNMRIAVLTQHVAEVVVGYREGASQDDYLVGSEHQLGGMIPCVDVAFGDDGLQLQWRQERGYGYRLMVGIETNLCGQLVLEELWQIDVFQVIQEEIVLVLHVHIFHQRAMEVKGCAAVSTCVGSIVSGVYIGSCASYERHRCWLHL